MESRRRIPQETPPKDEPERFPSSSYYSARDIIRDIIREGLTDITQQEQEILNLPRAVSDHDGWSFKETHRTLQLEALDLPAYEIIWYIPQQIFLKNFHPHPLKSNTKRDVKKDYWCASCHKNFKQNVDFFSCERCNNLFMDYGCALMEPVKCESSEPYIQHFTRQHPMPLVEIFYVEEAVCFACQSPCFGASTYACEKCKYFLHKRCAECPLTKVTHSSHPSHPLRLSIDHEKRIGCKCCERKVSCFILRCTTCDWNMCIECYLLPKTLNHEKYYFHSHHPDLTLSLSCTKFTCSLCHISFENLSCFKCTTCDFVVDVECELKPSITPEGQGRFRHFGHPHPMTLFGQKNAGDGVNEYCFACNSPCTPGQAFYSCANCKYFLHKICAELPFKVNNHLHQHPNLILLPRSKLDIERFFCSLCHIKDCGLFFRCCKLDCEFKICGRCVSLRPNIEFEKHGHNLCVVEKVHDLNFEFERQGRSLRVEEKVHDLNIDYCQAYDGYCKLPTTSVELRITESSVFRCVDCNFNSHLLCGPLPRTITCDHHMHPLILFDSVVEGCSDEYYCDICECERDPRICVYYCQECHYIAHVHCLISKVRTHVL